MELFVAIAIFLLVLNIVLSITLIGKEREPLTPAVVIGSMFLNTFFIWVYLELLSGYSS